MHIPDLSFTVDIFLVVWIKEVCHTVVGDLDLVVVLQQDVASSQVPVDHAVVLQVVHALKHKHTLMHSSRLWSLVSFPAVLTLAIWTHQLRRRWGSRLVLCCLMCSSKEPCELSCVTSCRLGPEHIPSSLTMYGWSRLPMDSICYMEKY